MLPLEGIKVLDLTRVLTGPFCTMILADMGAEVIKVEIPGEGDESRGYTPFLQDESGYFMSINRDKKGITLNLKTEEGKEIFKKLVKWADVITENYKPGTMKKLGLDYEALKEIKPDIIYAATSGFGQTGPYSDRPAYDAVVQGMGGIVSITGPKGSKGVRVGSSIADITAALYTVIGILSALHVKDKTGEGQFIDISMLDCQVSILENAIARYLYTGQVPKPQGNKHPSICPFESFECSDGKEVMIAIGNDNLWAKFCRLVGRDELINDQRFATNRVRLENYEDLKPIMDDIMKQKSLDEWLKTLEKNAIPCGPINTIDKVVKDPQVLYREMLIELEHPKVGKITVPGVPIKFSKTPAKVRFAAPTLGQHNEEVFTSLGYTSEQIEEFKNKGVI
ncbi:MAG: CaiB/BaiF CoA-transferase family protein [Thermoanaerobacteraceae bacterium]|nr:CaiB/BaiF CoA-transferase family protein [Thermoanaerobacteraceae bacterium]